MKGNLKEILTLNFIFMLIGVIVSGTAQMAVNTNVAAYAVGEVGITQAQFGVTASVAGIVVVVLYPFLGILCDKMRHGVCGFIGCMVLGVGYLLYLPAGGFAGLMIARIIQFVGFGFILNAALSIAAAGVRPEVRAIAMTLYGLGPAVSYFLGPWSGTSLFTRFGFNTMFIVCAILGFVSGIFFIVNRSRTQVDPNAPKKKLFGFEKTAVPGFFLSFLIIMIVFISQSYTTVSLLERGIAQAALFWTVGAVINIIARLFISGIIARIGINKVFYVCVALLVLSVILIAVSTTLAMAILAGICWGIGYNGTQASIMSVSVLRSPKERIGEANSTHQMGHNLGQVVWAPIAGVLIGVMGYQKMFLFMLIPMAAGIVFYIVYVQRIVRRVETERKEQQAQAQAEEA